LKNVPTVTFCQRGLMCVRHENGGCADDKWPLSDCTQKKRDVAESLYSCEHAILLNDSTHLNTRFDHFFLVPLPFVDEWCRYTIRIT
jgi:hypothetical protein